MATLEEYTHQRLITVPDELWTEVLPGLWQGGTDDDDTIDVAAKTYYGTPDITTAQFDAVVTLYAWARPVDWHVEELRFGVYDAELIPETVDALNEAADWAYRRWQNGKRVLIRCQAGISRSGLLTALVLMRHGMDVDDAIGLLREKRSEWVLGVNPDFTNYLYSLEEADVE